MIPRRLYAALLLALSARGQQQGSAKKQRVESDVLQADMNTDKLMSHLQAFQDIADANGGNRAFGFPGYQASVDYVLSQISSLPDIKFWTQEFSTNFSFAEAELRIGANLDTVVTAAAILKGPLTPESGIEAELVAGPEGDAACNDTSYANLNVKGKIVVVERGFCDSIANTPWAGKILAAAKVGAVAVLVHHSIPPNELPPRERLGSPSLPEERSDLVPAGYLTQPVGLDLKSRIASNNGPLRAYFRQKQIRDVRTTQNVLAETTKGDPNNVVMLGAHLDSVPQGAGINDNASGSSLILELLRNVVKYRTKNKIRVGWWAAEEHGLLGSKFYCENITKFPVEANKILAYLNFDMVSRGTHYIGDADGGINNGYRIPAGSDVIEQLWIDYFKGFGVIPKLKELGGDSDNYYFQMMLKKPVGFLFTGVDPTEDPCYHKQCDRVDGMNATLFTANAKAAAYMTAVLATNGTTLLPKRIVPT